MQLTMFTLSLFPVETHSRVNGHNSGPPMQGRLCCCISCTLKLQLHHERKISSLPSSLAALSLSPSLSVSFPVTKAQWTLVNSGKVSWFKCNFLPLSHQLHKCNATQLCAYVFTLCSRVKVTSSVSKVRSSVLLFVLVLPKWLTIAPVKGAVESRKRKEGERERE